MGMVSIKKEGRRYVMSLITSSRPTPLFTTRSISLRILLVSKIKVKIKSPRIKGLISSLVIWV
jgi:hypothetical protein